MKALIVYVLALTIVGLYGLDGAERAFASHPMASASALEVAQ